MKGTTALLEDAIELLQRGWNPGPLSKDALGNVVDTDSPHAVSWSLEGALDAVCLRCGRNCMEVVSLIHRANNIVSIGEWEDAPWMTQADVIALLRTTIAKTELRL